MVEPVESRLAVIGCPFGVHIPEEDHSGLLGDVLERYGEDEGADRLATRSSDHVLVSLACIDRTELNPVNVGRVGVGIFVEVGVDGLIVTVDRFHIDESALQDTNLPATQCQVGIRACSLRIEEDIDHVVSIVQISVVGAKLNSRGIGQALLLRKHHLHQ